MMGPDQLLKFLNVITGPHGHFQQCSSLGLIAGADPGFFLGGDALVSCSTSTPINHIVFFFRRIPVVLKNRRSSQGGGVRTPCTLPLDPPLNRDSIFFRPI